MKKKAIVYIITKLELGGAQKVCLSLFQGLQKTTQDYDVFLISGTQGYLTEAIKEHVHVILLPELTREIHKTLTGLRHEYQAFKALTTRLKNLKKNYHTVIVHTHSTKAGYLGRWAAWFAGIKQRIHTIHGFGFNAHQSWPFYLLAYVLELLTSFITTRYIYVSSYDYQVGKKQIPFFAQKSVLIRAAIQDKIFTPTTKPLARSCYIFGTVACFKPQKNIFDLLAAFHETHKRLSYVKLEIIGDGDLRQNLETWIFQHNLSHAISLLGWQDDVALHMKNWNCFVLTSLWEGLPCAIVEARFLSLPVIAYDVGGIKDIITSPTDGVLIAPKNINLFSQAMQRYAQQPQKIYPAATLEDYRQQTMLDKHLELYQKL